MIFLDEMSARNAGIAHHSTPQRQAQAFVADKDKDNVTHVRRAGLKWSVPLPKAIPTAYILWV
jgi:hypothetical protein